MSISEQRRLAARTYESGLALFEQGLYRDALRELQQAEAAFRGMDVRGQPFSHPLSNGVSGLANSLALAGQCHQMLGDYRAAITCYETSLINAAFEKKKQFRLFLRDLTPDLAACYQQAAAALSDEERDQVLAGDPESDISFRFPYSLPPAAVPFARLYELAPERNGHIRAFYERARNRDAERRRAIRTPGIAGRRAGIWIWSILAALWAAYAIIVIRAMLFP